MKLKNIVFVPLSAALFAFILVSCLKDIGVNAEQYSLSQAKEYFEANATDLSVPIFGTTTKSCILNSNNIIPQWEMAKLENTDSSVIYEIPLIFSNRLIGTLLNVQDSVKSARIATFAISLIIEKLNNEDIPATFISSILISNKKVKPEYIGNRDKYNGFAIKSQLDGNIIDIKFYKDGLSQKAMLLSIDIDNIPKGYMFHGFSIRSVMGTKGGDPYIPGEDDSHWKGWATCSSCGYTYPTNNILKPTAEEIEYVNKMKDLIDNVQFQKNETVE